MKELILKALENYKKGIEPVLSNEQMDFVKDKIHRANIQERNDKYIVKSVFDTGNSILSKILAGTGYIATLESLGLEYPFIKIDINEASFQ